MARTKLNQRSASRATVPMGATGGRTPPSKMTVALLATSIVSAVWAAAMLTPPGRVAYVYLFMYAEFYMGVLTLVSLSITVMVGLVATDRMVLSIRQRVLMQSAHRTTGIIAVAALVIHVTTKFSMGYITAVDVFVPFLAANQTVYVGLGTIAGMAMVSVVWTGIVRARFAGRGKPWMWRALHSVAYLAWPIALTHGLAAGRAAATWVVVSYIVCVLFVLIALAVRLSVSLGRRKDFASTSTGSIKPVGKLVPTSSPGVKARSKRRDRGGDPVVEPIATRLVADRGNAPAAVLDSWVPAAPVSPATPVGTRPTAGPVAPVTARPSVGPVAPVTARPAPGPVAPVSGRPYDDVYRPPGSRSRRFAGQEEPEPRPGRDRYDDDRYEEAPVSGGRFAEPGYEEAGYDDADADYDEDRYEAELRARRYADDDGRPRAARRGADRYDEVTRPISPRAVHEGRRQYADADQAPRRPGAKGYDAEAPDPRQRRYADEQETAPRTRRYAEQDEPAPRARRDRSVDRPVEPQRPGARSRRYADQDEPPAARQRRYTEDEYREPPRARAPRYDDQQPTGRSNRYAEDDEPSPRPRRDRAAAVDRDPGRHSRSDLMPPADPWGGIDGGRPSEIPPDDTPTLIDMASRRARRAIAEAPRATARGSRRRGAAGDDADDMYWRQLRGEAQ